MRDIKKYISSILLDNMEEIFNLNAVYEMPEYISSTTQQARRQLFSAEPLGSSGFNREERLEKCMRDRYDIGPYEHSLLYRFMNSIHKVIIFRAGAGSGKSSTIHHINNFCMSIASELKWKNAYDFNRFFLVINVQSIRAQLHFKYSRRESIRDAQLITLMNSTSNLLNSELDNYISAENRLSLYDSILFKRQKAQKISGAMESACSALRNIIGVIKWKNADQSSREAMLNAAINDLKLPMDQDIHAQLNHNSMRRQCTVLLWLT